MNLEMMCCPKCQRPVANIETATCPNCFSSLDPVLVPDSIDVSSADSLSQAPGFAAIPAPPSLVASADVPPPPNPSLSTPPAGLPGYAPPASPNYAPPASPGYVPPSAPEYASHPVSEHSTTTATTSGAPNIPQPGGFAAPTSSLLTSSAYDSTHTPQKPGFNFGNLFKIVIGGVGAVIYVVFRLGTLGWGVNRIFNHHNRNSRDNASAQTSGEIENKNRIAGMNETNPYLNYLGTPSSGALAAMNAIHTHDWRKLYYVSAHSGEEKKDSYRAAAFVEERMNQRNADRDPSHLFNVIGNATSFKVLPSIVKSGKSDVQTVWQLTFKGKKMVARGVAHMIKTGHGWELNSSAFPRTIYSDLVGDTENR